jgi:5'(3')-deoxyribonucleotidase
MICPKCKSEYREDFTMCSDCNVPLVEKLSSETEEEDKLHDVDFECIASTNNAMDVALIKSILDSENIKYYVTDEMSMSYLVAVPARFFVEIHQVEMAKELITGLDMNYTVI